MNNAGWLLMAAVLSTPASAVAQTYDYDAAMDQASRLQQQYGAGAPPAAPAMPKIVELEEADITGFINTMTELKALGLQFDRTSPEQGPARTMAAIEANDKALRVVRNNGFTVERLSQVAYSVALGLAGLEIDADDLSRAKAESARGIEQMRGQMSPEQFAAIQSQLNRSMNMVDDVENQPKGNLELVAKHRVALESAYE